MSKQLLAGVARADITPPVGIAHANWGAQAHERAAGVDLPLWATALALSDGEQTTVLVDLDVGGLRGEAATTVRAAAAERAALPVEAIRLAYTHTHSGPSMSVSGGWATGGVELVEGYIESLAAKVGGIVWQATHTMQRAHVAAGTGRCGIGINRRYVTPEKTVVVGHNPDGPLDSEVNVVRIDDDSGQPLAILVNYACHPIIVGPYNDLITPDFPGVVKRVVEEATGATCLFLQGATGDIGPIEGCTRREPLPIYRKLGTRLGYAAVHTALELEPKARVSRYVRTLESGAPLGVFEHEPIETGPVRLQVVSRTMQMPVREFPPPAETEAVARQCAEAFQAAHRAGDEEAIRWAGMEAKRAAMRAQRSRVYHGQTHTPLEIHAIRLNEIAIVGVPGEPFVGIGLAIKAASPFSHTLFSGYSNGGGSYIPMAEDFPVGGYEVDVSPFTPQAAQVMIDECVAVLNGLAQDAA